MLTWLPWEDATGAAVVAGAGAAVLARRPDGHRAARAAAAWAREATVVLVLYGLWQYAGRWSLGRADLAVARGRWLWRAERALHLPSEAHLQGTVLAHHDLVRAADQLYAQAHVPALAATMVWLFARHRHHYRAVRTIVAVVTGLSLALQLIPVAPPRLSGLGMVDTGLVVGPSDYAGGAPGIDQLSAMPSLHVGWALVVAGAALWASSRRARWLAAAYPVATVWTVVVTANHYWLDAAVAAALCAVAVGVAWRLGLLAPPDRVRGRSGVGRAARPLDPGANDREEQPWQRSAARSTTPTARPPERPCRVS